MHEVKWTEAWVMRGEKERAGENEREGERARSMRWVLRRVFCLPDVHSHFIATMLILRREI